jgi:hypothetical protein
LKFGTESSVLRYRAIGSTNGIFKTLLGIPLLAGERNKSVMERPTVLDIVLDIEHYVSGYSTCNGHRQDTETGTAV